MEEPIILSISKKDVYAEVAKTTAYTGAKMTEDADAYGRISTLDADEALLDRFWDEARAEACQALKRIVESEGMAGDRYTMVLCLSESFDRAQLPSMQIELLSYFVQTIVAKWYAITNKQEAMAYAAQGASLLESIHRKALYKRKPTRPRYE